MEVSPGDSLGVRTWGCKGIRAQELLVNLNRGDQDNSNGTNVLKIESLLRKLWAKTFQSLLPSCPLALVPSHPYAFALSHPCVFKHWNVFAHNFPNNGLIFNLFKMLELSWSPLFKYAISFCILMILCPCTLWLNREDQDDSNRPSGLKIGSLLRKLWAWGQFKIVFCSPPCLSAKRSNTFGYNM